MGLCILIGIIQYGLAGQFFGCVYSIFSDHGTDYSFWSNNDVCYGAIAGAIFGLLAGISLPHDRFMILSTIVIIGLSAVAGQLIRNSHEFGLIMGLGGLLSVLVCAGMHLIQMIR